MSQTNVVSGFAKLTQLFLFILFCLRATPGLAEDYFSPDFIETRGNITRDIDISLFSKTDGQVPGVYHVEIYLNGNYVETRDISFVGNESALSQRAARLDGYG